MDDWRQKAFEFASDTVKQLITLATGVIALTITFSSDFLSSVPDGSKPFLMWGWLAYFISILGGVWTMLALTGTLGRISPDGNGEEDTVKVKDIPASIYGPHIRIPSAIQILLFLVGTILIIIFGINALLPSR